MAISFLSPLPPADGWAAHLREVKQCRGAACYGALAAHFGTDSPKELEWRVDRKRPYKTKDEDSSSNKYLRWRQGKTLPRDDSVVNVHTRSAGAVRLDFWRNLPLWDLLAPDPPSVPRLHRILEQSPEIIRRILFGHPDIAARFHHSMLEREQTLAIRNHYSLEAFIALLSLSRKGEILEDDPHHFLPAACAFDILPRILYSYPPLRYRWEILFRCLDRIFWQRNYSQGCHFKFPIERIRAGLEALDADPASVLPRMSGKRLRVIDDDPISEIEAHIARAVSVT